MKPRSVIAAVVLSASLVSCSGGESLPTIELSSAGSARDAAKNETASDSPFVAGGDIRYVAGTSDWGGAADANTKKWPAWNFTAPTGDGAVRASLGKVTAALGLVGTPEKNASTGSWQVVDKSADLTFEGNGDQGTLWWSVYVTSLRAAQDKATKDCPEGAACIAPDEVNTPSTIPSGEGLGGAEAEDKAKAFLAAMGVDISEAALGWTSGSDPYGTYVTAAHLFRGAQTGMTWSFAFGANGGLLSAGGVVFLLEQAGEYPVIDVDAAIKRLNDGLGFAYDVVATRTAVAPGRAETHIVKVVGAAMSVVPWWMHDGGQMLLPAYDMELDDGSHVSVVAVSDKYVKFPGPDAGDVPADSVAGSGGSSPASPGSAVGTVVPAPPGTVAPVTLEQARTLIGLTLKEAQKVCDGNGWTLRVARLEGKENLLTTDWQAARVNVEIEEGLVTSVSVG